MCILNSAVYFTVRKHDYGRQTTGGEDGYSDDDGACGYSGNIKCAFLFDVHFLFLIKCHLLYFHLYFPQVRIFHVLPDFYFYYYFTYILPSSLKYLLMCSLCPSSTQHFCLICCSKNK